MNYPQQPQQPYAPQPYFDQGQAPAYPPQPQFPQQPQGYPAGPPMAYAQPAYPQQGYAQPYPAPPVAPPLPQGSLDEFYSQPSGGGGPSWKFNNKPVGTQYAGIVARTVTKSDIRAATDQQGRAQTFRDGRQKWIMVVPMQVQPSQEFPDGVAGWWVKGQARDELARAMAEAGAPEGPPEAGAAIRVTFVGRRPIPNMTDAFTYRVEYVRPGGALPPQQQMQPVTARESYMADPSPAGAAAWQAAAHAPAQGQAPVGIYPQQMPVPQQFQQAQQAQYPQQMPVQPPAPQQVPAAAPSQAPQQMKVPAQATAGMTADQQQLYARLTGQPQG